MVTLDVKHVFTGVNYILLKQTRISTCLPPFFCPLVYNGQWKEKINFTQHLTTYKFSHCKKSNLSTYIQIFWPCDASLKGCLCEFHILSEPRSLEILSSLVAYWDVLLMACLQHEPLKRTCKFNDSHEIIVFRVMVMLPKLVPLFFT